VAQAYYWHRFYSHQPDLNFDNPAVFEAVSGVLDFWFGLGVDGMRLDAVPYLVEREGTHSENLRPTHAILKKLRRRLDERFANRMFIAEANQWPEDAAAYFGRGDESHMVFHFPLMPRLFIAMRQEDRLPIVDILAQTPPAPRGGQWALFLRNHDELTLEMVTEEERRYMYYVYATDPQARLNLGIRRRHAPLAGNDRRRIELLNMLLFSLPGTPIVYYGDEIGMGDNIYLGDRNGVRTPMQWSADRNAGFSGANPQRLYLPLIVDDQYHHQAVHVEQQAANGHSLLSWMRRLIAVRRRYQAFGRGSMEFVDTPNAHVLAYVRQWGSQRLLVVANLSRFAQQAALQLARFEGQRPIEVFGRRPFPTIATDPYPLTLGPHESFWFELVTPHQRRASGALPQLRIVRRWEELLEDGSRADLEAALPRYVEACASWSSGARHVLSARIEDVLRVEAGHRTFALLVLHVGFTTGEPQRHLLPIGSRPARRGASAPDAIAHLRRASGGPQVLYDASLDGRLASSLLDLARRQRSVRGAAGHLDAAIERDRAPRSSPSPAPVRRIARTRRGPNTIVPVDGHVVLKLFRQLEEGPSPEIEIGARLDAVGFAHTTPMLGSLHYTIAGRQTRQRFAVGILQPFVPNQGEAWTRAVDAAAASARRAARGGRRWPRVATLVPAIGATSAAGAHDPLFGGYLDIVRLLARRTAELHAALASRTNDPAFTPEVLGPLSRRATYQRMRTLAVSVLARMRLREAELLADLRPAARAVVLRQDEILAVFREIMTRSISAARIRCHGNLHLGQCLHVGDDVVLIDFEGEPGRPLSERRLKRSPLQDVAAMVRSFHYAAHAAARRQDRRGGRRRLTGWLRHWQQRTASVFVDEYVTASSASTLLPDDPDDRQALLHAHLLERACYELAFELDHRSWWVGAPLADLPLLLTAPGTSVVRPSATAT
jgi:maltose alpha-D-glucosyltransferase/alpha-amylase